MWAVSDGWDLAWRTGGVVVASAEVWTGPTRLTLPDGSTQLQVVTGSVTYDEASKIRRTCSLTLANTDLDPVLMSDILSPLNDVHLFSGITYTDGTVEQVPVGVYRIADPGRSGVLAALQLTGNDYAQVLADARFLKPWATPKGARIVDQIQAIAVDGVAGMAVVDLTGSKVLSSAVTWEKDRWDAILALARSIGAEVLFDQTGTLIIRPVPRVSGAPVWSCDAGSATANMTNVATGLSMVGVYNAVVATTSASGVVPFSGIAYQTSGPLKYVKGSRAKPRFYASPLLATVNQCYTAATSILVRSVTYSRKLAPQSVPNPALDVGDLITVTLPSTRSELRAVSRITLPLGPGTMTLDTRVAADVGLTDTTGSLS